MTDRGASHPLLAEGYKRWLLFVLLVASTLSFADRSVFATVSQVVKQDLQFSDFELGFLQGVGFAIFYAVSGVPISRLAERYSRVKIIAISVAGWSIMTALSALPVNFSQMLIARAGVGIGEAGGNAPSTSLVSDHFTKEKRSSANAIVFLGSPVGSLIGALIGGAVAQEWGWRAAFWVMAAPGLLVALLVLFGLKEPPRGLAEGAAPTTAKPPSLWAVFKYLLKKPTFVLVWIAGSLAAIGMSGVSQFMVPFLSRAYHMKVGEVAQFYGWISFFSLSAGMLIGGYGVDRLTRRDYRWQVWAPAIGVFFAAPFYVGAALSHDLAVSVACLIGGAMSLFIYFAPTIACVQNMVPPTMRATTAAVFNLVFSTAGPGFGPTIMGALSDFFAKRAFQLGDFEALCRGGIAAKGASAALTQACASASSEGLREAFIGLLSVVFVSSAIVFVIASRTLKRDVYNPEPVGGGGGPAV